MSTKESKTPQPIIPVEEVKKENTKGDKKGSGKTNKGPDAEKEKTDRKNLSGQKRVTPNAKRVESAYIRKSAVNNGEGEKVEEEQKQDGGQKKVYKARYERVSKYNFDRDSITLETPIPIKPTQKELLEAPKKENLIKLLEELDLKGEQAKTLKQNKIGEIVTKDKTEKSDINARWEPLSKKRKEQLDLLKLRKEDHEKALAELKSKQETQESLKIRVNELRSKMKNPLSEDQIKTKVEELELKLQGEKLNNQQERKLVLEIEDLKLSLPHAAPLQKLQEELNEISKETKKLKDRQSAAYKHMKEVNTELDKIKTGLDELKKIREEINSGNPDIEKLKTDCNETLAEIKVKKEEARAQFDASYKAYEDQQELLRYVDFVKRQHENLKKKDLYKKRDEERKKREEEDKAQEEEKKKSKYVVYVEIADLLVQYLEKLSGKGDKKDFLDTNETEAEVQPQNTLTKEDLDKLLKKDKLTVLVSKKDLPDKSKDLFGGNVKRGKAAKKQELLAQAQSKPHEKPVEKTIEAFTHSYDIMQQFEKLSVAAPTFKNEIEKTITLLNEKKQYYIDLPNKEDTAAGEHGATGDKQEKKQQKKQNKIEFDESSFPTIEEN